MSETDTEVIPKLCKYIYSSSQEKVAFHEVRPAFVGRAVIFICAWTCMD